MFFIMNEVRNWKERMERKCLLGDINRLVMVRLLVFLVVESFVK